MRQIQNPFERAKSDSYNCFGCAPENKIGLALKFWEEGDEVVARWQPHRNFEGYNNVVHGGIQATLMDEVASWTVYIKCETAGVTASMDVSYKHPVYVSDGEIEVRGKLVEQNRRFATIETRIVTGEGKVSALGQVKYFIYPTNVAKEKLNYPGIEAFFKEE